MAAPCFTITYGQDLRSSADHPCKICRSCFSIFHFLKKCTYCTSQKNEGTSKCEMTSHSDDWTKDEEKEIIPDIICFYNHLVSLASSQEDNSEPNCSRCKKLPQSHAMNYLKFTIGQTEYKVRESFLNILKSQLIDSIGQDNISVDPQTGKLKWHKKD